MKYYVRPTVSGENFTAGKLYEIQHVFGGGRVVVLNDAKEEIIVRCDGIASARLNWRGRFEIVDIPEPGEAQEYAVETAKKTSEALREHVKGIVKDSIVSAALPGGVLHKAVTESDHLRAVRQIAANATELASEVASGRYDASLYMRLEKAEREAAQHKADCIKAEAVIDQLYDLFPQVRNHDQLIAAVKRSKIFSDAFIELQKTK